MTPRSDLTPSLLARLFDEGLIVAVKEFTGDVRRPTRSPSSPLGSTCSSAADDVGLELALAGARGWVAGFPHSRPPSTVAL
ncbi:hypothetical protein [Nonomuraea dietziae]|uniref:hypothetical protein n=1 Tax=Nonomuraea dietziae TaxID=65515 RepID=UPI0031D57226